MKKYARLMALLLSLLLTAGMTVPSFAAGVQTATTRAAAATTKAATTTATTPAATTTVPVTTAASSKDATAKDAAKTVAEETRGKGAKTVVTDGASTGDRTVTARSIAEITNSYNNSNGRVLCVAKNGMPRLYPEDSLEGFQAAIAAGVDILSFNVQKTSDGQLVVFEDKNVSRMLVNEIDGKTASGDVSQYTLKQMQTAFFLRNGKGGENRAATKLRVPALKDVLEQTKGNAMVYLSNGWAYNKEINALARSINACETTILGGAKDAESIKDFATATGAPICHIAGYFDAATAETSAKSFAKESLDAGSDAVLMITNKDYSPIFKEATIKKFADKGRPMISATKLSLCGDHKDTIQGWEQLIDAGYSIIETDYPEELAAYISDIEAYRTDLTSLLTQAQTVNQDRFSKESTKELKRAEKAAEETAAKGAVSRTELDNARYDLQESIDALQYGGTVEKAKMPLWAKILLIVLLVLLLFVLVILALRAYNRARRKKGRKSADQKAEQKEAKKTFQQMTEDNLKRAKTKVDEAVPTIHKPKAPIPPKREPAAPQAKDHFTEEELGFDTGDTSTTDPVREDTAKAAAEEAKEKLKEEARKADEFFAEKKASLKSRKEESADKEKSGKFSLKDKINEYLGEDSTAAPETPEKAPSADDDTTSLFDQYDDPNYTDDGE